SSFSWSCSFAGPPKIIAPKRPFPIGSASVHSLAGLSYHRRRESSAVFRIDDANGSVTAAKPEFVRNLRRVIFIERISRKDAKEPLETRQQRFASLRLCVKLSFESLHLDGPFYFPGLTILT